MDDEDIKLALQQQLDEIELLQVNGLTIALVGETN